MSKWALIVSTKHEFFCFGETMIIRSLILQLNYTTTMACSHKRRAYTLGLNQLDMSDINFISQKSFCGRVFISSVMNGITLNQELIMLDFLNPSLNHVIAERIMIVFDFIRFEVFFVVPKLITKTIHR